jgi:3-isopropylmalate/(R)-2-methylmalate dehydratase small subunit
MSAIPTAREPLVRLTSRYVVFDADDVDTDQIIPARFLTTTERAGLGRYAFYDRRFEADGSPKAGFPIDAADATGAQVLVTGKNFGCGSSREHAVWALRDLGFRVVIADSFADIFRSNAYANGVLPVVARADVIALLAETRTCTAAAEVTVDLEQLALTIPDGRTVPFDVPPFARHCILHGLDELEFLLDSEPQRVSYESASRLFVDTRRALRTTEVRT